MPDHYAYPLYLVGVDLKDHANKQGIQICDIEFTFDMMPQYPAECHGQVTFHLDSFFPNIF